MKLDYCDGVLQEVGGKSLYVSSPEDGEIVVDGHKFICDANISAGPDNVPGTYDDGLPATYEEFFMLCDELYKGGIDPVIWSGEYQFYITNTINALITDFNGYENEKLFYNYEGKTDKYITGWEADGVTPKLGEKEIELSNGQKQLVTQGNWQTLIESLDNPVDRKNVFESIFKPYEQRKNTFAAIYESIQKSNNSFRKVRGYN